MNKQRRMEIDSLRKRIGIVKDELKNIKNCLQSVLDAEENAFDNMPEGLQSSYRGMCSEDAIDSMVLFRKLNVASVVRLKVAV